MLTEDAKLFLRENYQSLATDDPALCEALVAKGRAGLEMSITKFIEVFTRNMEAEGGQYASVMTDMADSIKANWEESLRYVGAILGMM
jgi:hypothetical protein